MKNKLFLFFLLLVICSLFSACDNGSTGKGNTPLNYSDLDAAIDDAYAAKAEAEISIDGSDVNQDDYWVTQEVMDALEEAIAAAEEAREQAKTQAQIDDVAAALNEAMATFNAEKQPGTKAADPSSLQQLIDDAKAEIAGVTVSADGSDVNQSDYWVTQEVIDALEDAIAEAEEAIASGGDIDAAYIELDDALADFVTAKKHGTKSGTVVKIDHVVTTWPVAGTITYGQQLSASALTGGTGSVPGTFAWTDGTIVPTVTNSGYSVTFTPNDANYNTLTQIVAVTVNKANPLINWPTNMIAATWQSILSDIWLPGNGISSVPGTFTWLTPSTVFSTGVQYPMVFTPDDTANYNVVNENVLVTVAPDIVSGTGINMTWIPAGSFYMGSPDGSGGINGSVAEKGRFSGETLHHVTLTQGFYMGVYQVTQAQYQYVMTGNANGINPDPSYFTTANFRPPIAGEVHDGRPVETVIWYETLVFCNRLSISEGLTPAYSISGSTDPDDWGTVPTSSNATWNAIEVVSGSTGYRLPTEAQWEYACRAGTTTAFNDGTDDWEDTTALGLIGWFYFNSNSRTHEVGKKAANDSGLYDMHGNVFEWCWDWYGTYPGTPQTDPTGASSGSERVGRGGVWDNFAQGARSAYRFNYIPYDRYYYLGFRLVRP